VSFDERGPAQSVYGETEKAVPFVVNKPHCVGIWQRDSRALFERSVEAFYDELIHAFPSTTRVISFFVEE
jgi:hypothetical protein